MSTVTRASPQAPALPKVARGDAVFGTVAVLIAMLALIAKCTGVFV